MSLTDQEIFRSYRQEADSTMPKRKRASGGTKPRKVVVKEEPIDDEQIRQPKTDEVQRRDVASKAPQYVPNQPTTPPPQANDQS